MQPQLIVINSKDRASGTATNFGYVMKYYGTNSVDGFRINKISVPFSWYTIQSQSFEFIYDNISYTINVLPGQWTAVQLAAQLKSETDALIGINSVNWIWNQGANTFTVSSLNPAKLFSFNFFAGTYPTNYYYNIGVQMGFATPATLSGYKPNLTGTNSFTSLYAVNLTGGANIYIKSQSLQLYITSFFNKIPDNVIQSVPVSVAPSDFIVWQNTIETIFATNSSRPMSTFDFQLVDEYNTPLDLRGLDWTLELQIFYKF